MNGLEKQTTPQYLRVSGSVCLKGTTEHVRHVKEEYMEDGGSVTIFTHLLTAEQTENLTCNLFVTPVMDSRLVPMWGRKRDLIVVV